jgi:beta-glucanase (GH16 family)
MMRFVILLLATLISQSFAQKNGFCNLVFNDEFNGPTLDAAKWQKQVTCNGGGNNELQCYTPRDKNVFIEDGKLVLKVFKETYTGTQAGCTDSSGCTDTKTYTSGRVRSTASPSGSLLRGRMEIRAKLCSGNSLWPAIWMLPTDYTYGGWAASGEIDIMEQRGNHPDMSSGTLHHGGTWPNNRWTTNGDKKFNFDLSADYHVYGVEWTETKMSWFVDDDVFQTLDLNKWWNSTLNNNPYSARGQPWDRKFHFVLNVAVGGPNTGFFNGYPPLTDADQARWQVSEMRVDYVRAWQQGGDCTQSPLITSTPTTTSTTSTTTVVTSTPPNPTLTPITSKPIDPTGDGDNKQPGDDANGGDGNVESVDAPMADIAKTTIIVAAVIGGGVFLLGMAAVLVAVVMFRRAERNLSI